MKVIQYNIEDYAKVARKVAAEGCVLLENNNQLLPLKGKQKIALFGRSQFYYYKSGTGSGGMVNTSYVVGVREALEADPNISLNPYVMNTYQSWLQDNPFDEGIGWASEPWYQSEMPITKEFVQHAKKESDVAIVILGRTAGEDQDNKVSQGSYLLTDEERAMLKEVTGVFEKTIILLNVGNIIDMKWVKEFNPSSIMLIWQGGQEGGNGAVDVITGRVSPSGRLPDTIAYDISDYPSTAYYGNEDQNLYAEDIYVGYRYFETFAKEKVMYPFGFGLSYTKFLTVLLEMTEDKNTISFKFKVSNIGDCDGKEIVQLYVEAPQGNLGKASRSLCGFSKTNTLAQGESQLISIEVSKYYISSFDDSGVTGKANSFVLEAGAYQFYEGSNVRTATLISEIVVPDLVVMSCALEACAPIINFERMKPVMSEKGVTELSWESVPTRTILPMKRRQENLPPNLQYTGDRGYKLDDVASGKCTMDEFVAQLSDNDLVHIVRGEGMCSEKVTPGTAGAFGGVTDALIGFGIPIACCADGPSGIRMDCGTTAFSIPNGTCLASTFDEKLNALLFEYVSLEMRKNKVDTLLGPGINIHRNPLNGRNFEYFSEDPFLTGKMASAQIHSMHKYKVTGTIKHFACNNQEHRRHFVETVISGRALREIYLRGYEIAIKEAGAYSLMSTYGSINGWYTASNYDLLTTILRSEWGFEGIVMTDWWAKGNVETEEGSVENAAPNIRAQNDLMMVTRSVLENSNNDNLEIAIKDGSVSRGEFQRSAASICRAIMRMPAFALSLGEVSDLDIELEEMNKSENKAMVSTEPVIVDAEAMINIKDLDTSRGKTNAYLLRFEQVGNYKVFVTCRAMINNSMAQLPFSIFINSRLVRTHTLTGADNEWTKVEFDAGLIQNKQRYLKIFFSLGGIEVSEIRVVRF